MNLICGVIICRSIYFSGLNILILSSRCEYDCQCDTVCLSAHKPPRLVY